MHQDLVLILIGQFLNDLLLVLLLLHPNSILVKYSFELGEELLVLVQHISIIRPVRSVSMLGHNSCFWRSALHHRSLLVRVLRVSRLTVAADVRGLGVWVIELACTEAFANSHRVWTISGLLSGCFHELDGTRGGVLAIILRCREIPVRHHAVLTLSNSHISIGALLVRFGPKGP